MRLVLLLAWRHLAFRPGKTFASVVGIAVGIATVVSVLVVDHNTLLSQSNRRAPDDPDADLLVQPERGSGQLLEDVEAALRAEPLLSGVAAFASGKFTLTPPNDGRKAGVELMVVQEPAYSHHGAFLVGEGEPLDFTSDEPQLLIGRAVAEQSGVAVGDLVKLAEPPRRAATVVDCIDGELVVSDGSRGARGPQGQPVQHTFRVVGLLEPTRLGFHKTRVITTFATGSEILGRRLNVRFWADFDSSAADLQMLRERLGDSFEVTAPRRSLSGLAPEERAFRSGVRLCGFLALFLGLYIIFNTMSMSLVERVRSIGLLRSLGLTQGRMLGIFLAEGLALAVLGAVLSVLLANVIVGFMVERRMTTLGHGKPLEITEIPWGPALAVMGTGVLFCLLGVLYPFLRAAKLSVIDALRRGVIELSSDPFKGMRRSVLIGLLAVVPVAWFLGAPPDEYVPEPLYRAFLMSIGLVGSAFAVLLLVPGVLAASSRLLTLPFRGPATMLARSTMAVARHRVFGTVSGLMLVFTAIFLILSVLESLKAEMRHFGDRALADRLYVRTTVEGAALIPKLRKAEPELRTLSPLNAEITSSFLVRGVPERILRVGSLEPDAELRTAFVEEPTIILSTRCADDFEKLPGDVVRMATLATEGFVDFRVLAVTDEYGFAPDDRVFGVISAANMSNYWCVDSEGLGDYFMAWAPGTTTARAEELQARIIETLGEDNVISFRRGEDITQAYVDDLEESFAIFYAILVLTVILAAVGILNAMIIAVMERRREIGLLRSVGLTGGQVAGMLLAESSVLGLLGGVLGLALGIPLAAVTCQALTEMSHLDLAFVLSPRAVVAVVGGSIAISVLAVLLPALRANRLRLSEVMRYE